MINSVERTCEDTSAAETASCASRGHQQMVQTHIEELQLQLHSYMEAALHVGITLQELEEIVLQTLQYAGFPTTINAINVLAQFKGE